MNLLQMSLSGAVLIVVIVVIRAVTINRLPKNTFLVLWGIVLVRLLIPFSIPSELSVYSFIEKNSVLQNILSESQAARLLTLSNAATPVPSNALNPTLQNDFVFTIWQIIWAAGAVLITAFFMAAYIVCSMRFKSSTAIENDFVQKWRSTHKLKRKIAVHQADRITSPLTYGLFHPTILLPKTTDWENEQQLNYIFLHECEHIRRHDLIIKLVIITALCVHWFNPLVWVMYCLMNRDIELSCDEQVIRKCGKKSRAEYARALISMEERKSSPFVIYNSFSKNATEERIVAVMKYKRLSLFSGSLAFILVLMVGFGFVTSAAASDFHKPNGEEVQTDSPQNMFAGTTLPDNRHNDVDSPTLPTQDTPIPEQSAWVWPTESTDVSFYFGSQQNAANKTVYSDHINIRGETDDDVYAAIGGTVIDASFDSEYGNYIVVASDNNTKVIYGHLKTTLVSSGATVSAGERVGTVGATGQATGNCLSFAVFVENQAVDPLSYYE